MKNRLKAPITTAILIIITILTLATLSIVKAQNTTSPTPAPSKTPTLTPNPEETTEPPTEISTNTQPRTQADLSIVTGNIQRPNGLLWHNNKLYVSCSGDWTLYEINTDNGTTVQYIYGIRNAHTIYATGEDNETHLWIPDFQSNSFVHIHRGVTEVIASQLQGPWGVTPLDQETFAVSNLSGNTITAIKKDGTVNTILSGLRSPSGIAADEEFLYVANTGSARRAIEWYTKADLLTQKQPLNSTESTDHSLITGIQNATNINLAPDGKLYFTYALGTRGIVGRVDPTICRTNGGCTSEQIEIVLYTELAAPLAGLSISPDMELFIHTIFSPDLYSVQLDSP